MGISSPLGRMSPAAASRSPSLEFGRQMMIFSLWKKKRAVTLLSHPPSGHSTTRDRNELASANMSVKAFAGMSMGCAGFRSTIAGTKSIVRAPVPHKTRDQRAGHPPEE